MKLRCKTILLAGVFNVCTMIHVRFYIFVIFPYMLFIRFFLIKAYGYNFGILPCNYNVFLFTGMITQKLQLLEKYMTVKMLMKLLNTS